MAVPVYSNPVHVSHAYEKSESIEPFFSRIQNLVHCHVPCSDTVKGFVTLQGHCITRVVCIRGVLAPCGPWLAQQKRTSHSPHRSRADVVLPLETCMYCVERVSKKSKLSSLV